ncbi:MAG: S-(hydroxymethyl)glutathione dehydrogenase/alcohol dehydrogenase [Paracoccaceae bacterium]|jgi:S-(hydroxymethyl)glutathione dehydrogenase/alcohol dehydrogenase
MKAAVCHEFGAPLVVEDIALAAPKRGEVAVKLAACAICHSDILYAEGAWGGHLPAVYGHEASGYVTSIGDSVRGYAVGDTVLVTLIRSCGHCVSCSGGHPARCETGVDRVHGPLSTLTGAPIEHGLQTGAFAESVVVDQSQLAKIPTDIPMDAACLLSCGVITGVGAATNTASIEPGSTVVVIGAGGVGLNAIQGAAICGASKIIAVDLSQEKLDAAMEFGATHGVLAGEEKPHRTVKKLNGGRGVDYVLVTVGAIPAYQSATRYLSVGGTVVMVGMPPSGKAMTIEPVMMAASSHTLIGSNMGDANLRRDIPYLIELYQQGRLKLDELVTRRYKLEDINEAIADTVAGNARRNVIVFD